MRNRTKVAIAAIAVAILASATAFAATESFLVAALTTLTAFATSAFTVAALNRSTTIALNAHSRKHAKPLHDRLTRLDNATARTNDIAGSVHRLRRESETMRETLHRATQRLNTGLGSGLSAGADRPEVQKSGIYYATQPARTSLRSGPLAAAGEEKANEARLLRAIGVSSGTTEATKAEPVAYIGGPTPENSPGVRWTPLRPPFPVEQLQVERPRFILIDGPALGKGLWASVSDAAGSRIYLTLWEVFIHARSNQIPTVLIDQLARDSTFSEEIRIMSDIVVSEGRYSIGHEAWNNIHLVNEALNSLPSAE